MNKDVVYIEPEDDITDIIARIKGAKLKLVALVPPKKIGVLRSAVNTKLVAKAAKAADKVVVIVTTDSALIKLAAAAQIPVAKNLQSRPKLPSEIIEKEKELGEQVIDESEFDDDEVESLEKPAPEKAGKATPVRSQQSKAQSAKSADQSITSDDLEKEDGKKGKNKDKKGGKIPKLEKYRKWIIIGAVAFVLLVVFLVWAFVFAPAAKIAVAVRTTSNNFSENVSFVTGTGKENTSEGVFLLEEKTVEKSNSVEFTATGQQDVGEKAKGNVKITATFTTDTVDSTISVPAGTVLSRGEYQYTLDSGVDFRLDSEDDCTVSQLRNGTCTISANKSATAVESGEKYNIGAYDSGWVTSVSGISISNSAFSGGTSKVITIVSQTDFDKAKEKLNNEGKEDGKAELASKFSSEMVTIESSLEVNAGNPVATPGVGQEVAAGVTPKISSTTTYKMYAVDKTKLEDYIKKKTEEKLAQDQKIYAIDKPFFENFANNGGSYVAKLKSSTKSGPKVTEEDILEKSKGKKVGEVQSLLKSINGVSSVSVKTSFPWVGSVPDDPNKVTIELKVEE